MADLPLQPLPPNQLVPDFIAQGIADGWKAFDASQMAASETLSCDVVVIGTGAGGGISAEMLSRAGLNVIMIEEGPLKTTKDFKMRERDAYPTLYQESAARKTLDKGINILQGRSVGGSTTVNWTSSFRTPPDTLQFWQDKFALKELSVQAMAPWFESAERRLNVAPWDQAPNENNDLLRRGCDKLGIHSAVIPRNVKGCWNLGYCGMGCPTNAKQSMLVTSIPTALQHGARLYSRLRAERLIIKNNEVQALECAALEETGLFATGKTVTIKAKHFVVAGGAINNPGLLLRSEVPDPHKLLGTRTFLHPVFVSAGLYAQPVNPHSGAPQSIYSDHFLKTQAIDGPLGYKLEAPPLHPVLFSTTLTGFGQQHALMMEKFNHTHVQLALLRDGFHKDSVGGTVVLRSDGSPVVDYPLNDVIWEAGRRALLTMAELQFAAGAQHVVPMHEMATLATSWKDAQAMINGLPMKPLIAKVVSAHVMGGCRMAGEESMGVVRPDGMHWQVSNLSIHDGSVFPTSIGANPQLSIFGQANRMTAGLIKHLTGQLAQPLA